MKIAKFAAMGAYSVALSVCGAAKLDFAAADQCTLTNYRNRLNIVRDATEDGEKCLAIYGASNKCDTAFAAESCRMSIPHGACEFVVSVEAKGSLVIVNGGGAGSNWRNAITWFDGDGRKLSVQEMSHVAVPSSKEFLAGFAALGAFSAMNISTKI